MITGDMETKRNHGMAKVLEAIRLHNGTTILSTGITGDDARLAKAAVEAGAKMIEPNHPAVALARGLGGVTTMHAAEQIRHEVEMREMINVTRGVRAVVGREIYITVGIPGGFTELVPTEIPDEYFAEISRAGADGLHIHKSTIGDLEQVVKKAHQYGLLVDAYIAHPDDLHLFGLPARTPKEVAKIAKQMEEAGTDMIGLMTGMSYEGVGAGEIHPVVKERLQALVETVKTPTLAEGGINLSNFKAFMGTGVNILVVGTSIDDEVRSAARKVVRQFIER